MADPLPQPVADFIDAVNRHDEQAFLDAFTPQGYVDDWGRKFSGRDEIKDWSGTEFIGARGTISTTSISQDGDVVTVIGDWRSKHANGLSSFAFRLQGDRIASMTIREG